MIDGWVVDYFSPIDKTADSAAIAATSLAAPPADMVWFGPWEPFAFAASIHGRPEKVLWRRPYTTKKGVNDASQHQR